MKRCLSITVTEKYLDFKVDSLGVGQGYIRYSNCKDDENEILKISKGNYVSINYVKDYKATFFLKHLGNFAKGFELSGFVQLSFCEDKPVVVEYKFSAGFIKFYLAPTVNEDSDDEINDI